MKKFENMMANEQLQKTIKSEQALLEQAEMEMKKQAHLERVKKRGMKKGIQYSHYCGTPQTNLCCYHRMAMDALNDGDIEEAKTMLENAMEHQKKLRIMISDLDILNEMDY